MNWFQARLSEPSTWYGLGVLIAGIAQHFVPAQWQSALAGVQWMLGAAAAATPDQAAKGK